MQTPAKKKRTQGPAPRAVLLEELREFGRMLGRTPTSGDLNAHRAELGLRSVETYAQRFGTWTNAVKVAGFPAVRRQEMGELELIEQLKNLAQSLGRKITPNDVSLARSQHTCANLRTFRRVFGSVAKALAAAGVNQTRKVSDAKMLADLRKLAKANDGPVRGHDLDAGCRRGECMSYSAYLSRFGSLPRAFQKAGLEYVPASFSRAELLFYLRQFSDELGRPPTYREVRERAAANLMPSMMNYSRRFGGLHAALREAGIRAKPPNPKLIEQELIRKLRELTDELGHAPMETEWRELFRAGRIPSASRYVKAFGSINEARRLAGVLDKVAPPRPGEYDLRVAPARDEVLDHLRQLARELGRAPRVKDIEQARANGARVSFKSVLRICGTLNQACAMVGLTPVGRSPIKISDAELIAQLRAFAERIGRAPNYTDWVEQRVQPDLAAPETVAKRFGGWTRALVAAGLVPPPPRSKTRYERAAMLAQLREIAAALGRAPSFRDLRRAREANKKYVSASTIVTRFGSLEQALSEAEMVAEGG